MSKSTRKISQAQRDKNAINIAKKLKAAGIISKQANLHSGHYISRGVLKKVREYENISRLDYKAYKVPKKLAKAAKERGFEVVSGNKIIGPKTPIFRNRLKSGELTGVKPIKGGYMEEVILPHTVFDLRSLMDQLETGIDSFKLPNERFAFKYKGHESYRTFGNSDELKEYLLHYKHIDLALSSRPEDLQEEFDAISIFRLHPNDTYRVIPGATERRKRSDARRRELNKRRAFKPRDNLSTRALYMLREKERKAAQKKKDNLKKDPAALKAYNDAKAASMRKLREARKNEKR